MESQLRSTTHNCVGFLSRMQRIWGGEEGIGRRGAGQSRVNAAACLHGVFTPKGAEFVTGPGTRILAAIEGRYRLSCLLTILRPSGLKSVQIGE